MDNNYDSLDKATKSFQKISDKINKLYGTSDTYFDFSNNAADKDIHKKFSIIEDEDLKKEFIQKWITSLQAVLKHEERYEKTITLPKKVNYLEVIQIASMAGSLFVVPGLLYEYFFNDEPIKMWNYILVFATIFAFIYYKLTSASKVLTPDEIEHNKEVGKWFKENTNTRNSIVKLKRQLEILER